MHLFASNAAQRGPALICLGLGLVVLAHFESSGPVVTPLALVGWGALLTLHAKPRTRQQDSLSMLNLVVYSSLVCLAIVAQSHAMLQRPASRISLPMLLDHAGAIVLVIGLAAQVVRRISQPLAEER